MKKTTILSGVAGVLFVGGVVLIAPMFRSNPGESTTDVGVTSVEGDSESVFDRYADQLVAPSDKPSASRIVKYLTSEAYAKSSSADKRAYREMIVEAYSDPRDTSDMQARQRGMRALQSVPEDQRAAVERGMRSLWRDAMARRFERFFALSKEEQLAILDAHIDRATRWEAQLKSKVAANPDTETGQRVGARASDRGTRPDDAGSIRRIQWSIAFTTPATRARMVEAGRMMEARRAERGLPDSMFDGGFGGMRGGGGRRH
jgi:hypothetical protein